MGDFRQEFPGRGDVPLAEFAESSPTHPCPWALATSAFSQVLEEFGQTALHGRAGPLLADPLGTAASHGCVRFDNAVIRMLAQRLPNGTPIQIR